MTQRSEGRRLILIECVSRNLNGPCAINIHPNPDSYFRLEKLKERDVIVKSEISEMLRKTVERVESSSTNVQRRVERAGDAVTDIAGSAG